MNRVATWYIVSSIVVLVLYIVFEMAEEQNAIHAGRPIEHNNGNMALLAVGFFVVGVARLLEQRK